MKLRPEQIRRAIMLVDSRWPPVLLKPEALDKLVIRAHLNQFKDDVSLWRHQCLVAESFAAAERGESIQYIADYVPDKTLARRIKDYIRAAETGK